MKEQDKPQNQTELSGDKQPSRERVPSNGPKDSHWTREKNRQNM